MSEELSESDIFVLLAKRRRRLTLRILQESGTRLTATAIAERIREREDETPSAEDLDTVRLPLTHNHLPRLEAADAVRYDREAGTVHPGPNFDPLIRVLETVGEEDAWSDETVPN